MGLLGIRAVNDFFITRVVVIYVVKKKYLRNKYKKIKKYIDFFLTLRKAARKYLVFFLYTASIMSTTHDPI